MTVPGTHRNPQPKFEGVEVTPLVIKDLEERAKLGAKKYGNSLHSEDGRDTLIDLYQELLDAVEYTRSLIEQEKSLRKEVLQEAAAELCRWCRGIEHWSSETFVTKAGIRKHRAESSDLSNQYCTAGTILDLENKDE